MVVVGSWVGGQVLVAVVAVRVVVSVICFPHWGGLVLRLMVRSVGHDQTVSDVGGRVVGLVICFPHWGGLVLVLMVRSVGHVQVVVVTGSRVWGVVTVRSQSGVVSESLLVLVVAVLSW